MKNNEYFLTGFEDKCPKHPEQFTRYSWSEFFVQYVPHDCEQCKRESAEKEQARLAAMTVEERDAEEKRRRERATQTVSVLKSLYDSSVDEALKLLKRRG